MKNFSIRVSPFLLWLRKNKVRVFAVGAQELQLREGGTDS